MIERVVHNHTTVSCTEMGCLFSPEGDPDLILPRIREHVDKTGHEVRTTTSKQAYYVPNMPLPSTKTVEETIQDRIKSAKERILEVAATKDEWTAFDLKQQARGDALAATMGLALSELIEEGKLEKTPPYGIRLASSS